MAGIIDFPTVVQEALQQFGDLLPNEPQRRHFAEYLTGLFVAQRKNVCGINRAFAQTTDQSCLNRFLTDADWDTAQINQRRLDFLQQEPSTRYSAQGVIPIDNTLIDHVGQLIEDAGWFWDHAEERYKVAHDYLIVNYVCTSGKHYPLDFRRFQKQDLCETLGTPFKDHTALCQELIDWVCAHDIPGTFAFDSYFTNAPILNHIHGKQLADGQPRGYVGSLKFNRKLEYRGRVVKASELAAQIDPAARKELRGGGPAAVVFHLHVAHPGRRAQGARRHPLAAATRPVAPDHPGDESGVVGGQSGSAGVSAPLDRHGDLSSGWQAAVGHGGLSAA